MQTSKPISTISYNTEKFLIGVLNRLVDCKIISFRYFIKHNAEMDDKKEHRHLYIELNKKVDTEELREQFKEKDLSGANDKPLGVLPFVSSSSFNDCYLYFIHDEMYLASKNEYKEFHYKDEEIITSDKDYLYLQRTTTPLPKSLQNYAIVYRASKGEDITSLLLEYGVPLVQWNAITSYLERIQRKIK